MFKTMNMINEFTYWITFAHLPQITTRKKNEILVQLINSGKNLIDFFHTTENTWKNEFNLKLEQIEILKICLDQLPNNSFLAENLLEQGYQIIPITSEQYSKKLKKNLNYNSPILIYTKGNTKIFDEESIAIVGSRNANDISLEFTDLIAKIASKHFKVIVSGFAKGVDKQALDSAIKYNGQSIIVLPQGIATFGSGFKKYYKQIINGDVLVVSTFHPNAEWNVKLAMARNSIIYGLANEIFVAESNEGGGTWQGVIDGLKRGFRIYVRVPEPFEKNANNLLIEKGAIPIDSKGNIVNYELKKENNKILVKEPNPIDDDIQRRILELIKEQPYKAKEIKERLNINWSVRKITKFLESHKDVEKFGKKPKKYGFKVDRYKNYGPLFQNK